MAIINIEVTDQRREDMLCGAIEGGSNYWYYIPVHSANIIKEYKKDNSDPFVTMFWRAIMDGKSIAVWDIEEMDEIIEEKGLIDETEGVEEKYPDLLLGKIDLQSINKGEQIMAEKHTKHFTDMINEEDDAITADVWFQLAVMGKVVFG